MVTGLIDAGGKASTVHPFFDFVQIEPRNPSYLEAGQVDTFGQSVNRHRMNIEDVLLVACNR
jgi:hypothetical protein